MAGSNRFEQNPSLGTTWTGTIKGHGLERPVAIYRDVYGIPHIQAETFSDAFFAQGFVHAQDRFWQMDFDRMRAQGRAAEMVGKEALVEDGLMRRFRISASAERDFKGLKPQTQLMVERYADGVNTYLKNETCLPLEYRLMGRDPRSWRPEHCLEVFKVRHVLMGTWEQKWLRASLSLALGLERASILFPRYPFGHPLILPPAARHCHEKTARPLNKLSSILSDMTWLCDESAGSNSWAVSGARTASGKPILAGDPHRALDVPNVYYQNHLACADFDVIGLSFPGVPAFPHFGHNPSTAWCITHAMADYQDLFIERFRVKDGSLQFRSYQGWKTARVTKEVLYGPEGEAEHIDVVETDHGPIVFGDPWQGYGLAFSYTGIKGENKTFDCLVPMMLATNAQELRQSVRDWVDPCNNFVFADIEGAIGYQFRGLLPLRSSANAYFPVPGDDPQYRWRGTVPFEELPASSNPDEEFIITANNRIVGPEYPHYISLEYAPGFRAERIQKALVDAENAEINDMLAIHSDCVTEAANPLMEKLGHLKAQTETEKEIIKRLVRWDRTMDAGRSEPTMYSYLRDAVVEAAVGWAIDDRLPSAERSRFLLRARSTVLRHLKNDRTDLLPQGKGWMHILARALRATSEDLQAKFGSDMAKWQWGTYHRTHPKHPLSRRFPERSIQLDPPSVSLSGDSDTVLAASYQPGQGFGITGASTARYVFDLSNWERSRWVVPFGVSGHPESPHYFDQLPIWAEIESIPMLYDWERIKRVSCYQQRLETTSSFW